METTYNSYICEKCGFHSDEKGHCFNCGGELIYQPGRLKKDFKDTLIVCNNCGKKEDKNGETELLLKGDVLCEECFEKFLTEEIELRKKFKLDVTSITKSPKA